MSVIDTETRARTELLAKLELLGDLHRARHDGGELFEWRHELGWPGLDEDDFEWTGPFEPVMYMRNALKEATFEVFFGIGWGGSGPYCDRELIKAHAAALAELVGIARRRESRRGRRCVVSATLTDERCEELREAIGRMEDVQLVDTMLAMHAVPEWKQETHFAWAGLTPTTGVLTRLVFTEIAARWIPPQVFGDAFANIEEFMVDLGGAS